MKHHLDNLQLFGRIPSRSGLSVIGAETMTFFGTCVIGVNVGHTYHAILSDVKVFEKI
jgi:hypothetical protein